MQRSRSLRKPGELQRGPRPDLDPSPDSHTHSPSRLPVKPPSRIAIAAAGPPPAARQQAPATSRPALGLARAASTRAARDDEGRRYPPSSSSSRAVSSAQPGAQTRARAKTVVGPLSGGTPAGSRAAAAGARAGTGHARTKSNASVVTGASSAATAGVRAGMGHARTRSSATVLTSATTLRPPSRPSQQPSATATKTTTAAADPVTTRRLGHTRTRSAAAATTAGTSRPSSQPSSVRTQASRQVSSATTATTASGSSSRNSSNNSSGRTPSAAPRAHKPAFSALQQHYSPAKNPAPKPLTSTFLAPPSPGKLPSNMAISADTLRLQNDLLRHHVLHASEPGATASWHASARRGLAQRFEGLAAESRALSAEEARLLEDVNVAALSRWGAAGREERVQGLDEVLGSAWGLSEAGAKHARLVRRFGRWAERARELGDARARGEILDERDEPALVGEIEGPWKEECEALRGRLEGWAARLAGLRLPAAEEGSGSNLEGILTGCADLVDGMLSELVLMLEIEEGLVAREREWVRDVIRDVEDEGGAVNGAGAIWRAL